MKLRFLIFILSFFALLLFSASKSVLKNIPPGTIRLSDSIYIDRFPVKVMDYIEFLNSISTFYCEALHDSIQNLPKFGLSQDDIIGLKNTYQGDSLLHVQMLTRTWVTHANDERRYDVDYHLKSPRYFHYPIVNISYEQMRYYCQWRTDMVMLYYATNCKTEKQRRKYAMNFKYRLVKRKEWEKAISDYFGDIVKNDTDKRQDDKPNNVLKPYNPVKGRSLYYDVDNAAETLENEIVTFNFNWNKSVKIGNISYFKYDQPTDWISFRCVCEILPEVPIIK